MKTLTVEFPNIKVVRDALRDLSIHCIEDNAEVPEWIDEDEENGRRKALGFEAIARAIDAALARSLEE